MKQGKEHKSQRKGIKTMYQYWIYTNGKAIARVNTRKAIVDFLSKCVAWGTDCTVDTIDMETGVILETIETIGLASRYDIKGAWIC